MVGVVASEDFHRFCSPEAASRWLLLTSPLHVTALEAEAIGTESHSCFLAEAAIPEERARFW